MVIKTRAERKVREHLVDSEKESKNLSNIKIPSAKVCFHVIDL